MGEAPLTFYTGACFFEPGGSAETMQRIPGRLFP
jgi:hypothetical protein